MGEQQLVKQLQLLFQQIQSFLQQQSNTNHQKDDELLKTQQQHCTPNNITNNNKQQSLQSTTNLQQPNHSQQLQQHQQQQQQHNLQQQNKVDHIQHQNCISTEELIQQQIYRLEEWIQHNQPNQTNLQKINKKQQNIQGSIKETNRNICSLSQQQILSLQQGLQTLYSAHKLLHSLHQPPTTSANNRSNPASPTPTPTKHQTTTKTNRQTTTPPALPTTPAAKQPTLPPDAKQPP